MQDPSEAARNEIPTSALMALNVDHVATWEMALEEQSAAARRLGDRFEQRVPALAARYGDQAAGLEQQAALIRKVLRNGLRSHD